MVINLGISLEENINKFIRMNNKTAVIHSYRSLLGLIRRLPEPNKRINALEQLRSEFRGHSKASEFEIPNLLKEAEQRAGFLRIITPKPRKGGGSTRYLYRKDGCVEVNGEGTKTTDIGGRRVHTNWDGKNLDPCSVKRHYYGLKKMGFKNNLHAKGIF